MIHQLTILRFTHACFYFFWLVWEARTSEFMLFHELVWNHVDSLISSPKQLIIFELIWSTLLYYFKLDDNGGIGGDDGGDGGGDAGGDGSGDAGGTMNRIGGTCSKDNIFIIQGPTSPLPNGIPTYTVQVLNVCVSGCSVSNIHLTCGWFSSARLINPRIFRRIYFNDCLVNNGEALSPGDSLSFQYANSFRYPLSVSSMACD